MGIFYADCSLTDSDLSDTRIGIAKSHAGVCLNVTDMMMVGEPRQFSNKHPTNIKRSTVRWGGVWKSVRWGRELPKALDQPLL